MNIHEHQAKKILKEFGADVKWGGDNIYEIHEGSTLKSKEFILKAQIHAGGGKAGGVKLIKDVNQLSPKQKNDGKGFSDPSNCFKVKK